MLAINLCTCSGSWVPTCVLLEEINEHFFPFLVLLFAWLHLRDSKKMAS